jgi:hypothetical protein
VLFNIEDDFGDCLVGYLVPDGFSSVPSIRVSGDGEVLAVVQANEDRPALAAASRHETGRCGFRIDATQVPGLGRFADLELRDEETGILIYRRPPAAAVPRHVFRLETHLFPHWRLDDALRPYFQYHLRGAELFGRETVTQLFLLNKIDSSYVSGRILYKNYAYFIENGGHSVYTIVQDPYHELAERLLVFSKIAQVGSRHFGDRDSRRFASAIAFCETLSFADAKKLKHELRRMPSEVAAVFSNPLVRQLTATTPDEMPPGGAVAASLDLLASFALIGLRSEADVLYEGLAELLAIDPMVMPPLPQFASVPRLAAMLKESGVVDVLLEKDAELFYYLEEAIRRSRQSEDGESR